MTDKALFVAVGAYGGDVQKLTAPVPEAMRWKQLLTRERYGFKRDDVKILKDAEATVERVLKEIEILLDSAQPHSRLVFGFLGHGSYCPGTRPEDVDQAMIVYPGKIGSQFSAVRESDVDEIFRRKQPPVDARVTIILDTCFAGAYTAANLFATRGEDGRPIPLFIPPTVELFSANVNTIRTFEELGSRGQGSYAMPILMAASGKDQPAYEITDGGKRHLLFSDRAIRWLERKHDTYNGLMEGIRRLHPRYKQSPSLGRNTARADELFPGKAPSSTAPEDEPLPQNAGVTTTATTRSVNVRVVGLGCFVATSLETSRIILPFDGGEYIEEPSDLHLACIEVPTADLVSFEGTAHEQPYSRRGIEYARWPLDAVTLSIEDAGYQPFQKSEKFEYHVPKVSVLCPEVRPRNPRPQCFDPTPFPGLFAAFLDVPAGRVEIGPLHDHETHFERPLSGEVTWPPLPETGRHTPRSVTVTVPLASTDVTIVARRFPDEGEVFRFTARAGTTLLLANAREIDLSGDGSGSVPRKQFRLYYKLSYFDPGEDAPLPSVTTVPVDDCTVTDWP